MANEISLSVFTVQLTFYEQGQNWSRTIMNTSGNRDQPVPKCKIPEVSALLTISCSSGDAYSNGISR